MGQILSIVLAIIIVAILWYLLPFILTGLGIAISLLIQDQKLPPNVISVKPPYKGYYEKVERNFYFETALTNGRFSYLVAEALRDQGFKDKIAVYYYSRTLDQLGKTVENGRVSVVPVHLANVGEFREYRVFPEDLS